MEKFAQKVFGFIQKNSMTAPGETVIVGFSGGADSTALMEVLLELSGILKISIAALHVNHCIRQEAGEDELFVRNYCIKRDIPLRIIKEDVPEISRQRGISEEEAGRLVRYRAFEDYAKELGAEHIAVAHHQNDVAETLLMNLARGSGLRGAGAIRPTRDRIIRPLLCVSRREIEQYLSAKGQFFCTDRTNLENDHTRNIIRNVILPEFERSVNSDSVGHMFRAAASISEAEEYIRQTASKEFEIAAVREEYGITLDLEGIQMLPEIIKKYIVLLCFEELITSRKDFTYTHVMDVIKLIGDVTGSASVDLPYNLIAARNYSSLYIGVKRNSPLPLQQISLGEKEGSAASVVIPGLGTAIIEVFPYEGQKDFPSGRYTKWFDYDRIQAVVFRTRRRGDVISIRLDDVIHKKPLTKLMTDVRIPKERRDFMYILADGSEVLWVPGYRMSDLYKVNNDTRNILAIKITNGGISDG